MEFVATGEGNTNLNPLFDNPQARDYRLCSLSPCIDASNGDFALPYDLKGQPRYDDRGVANTGVGYLTGI